MKVMGRVFLVLFVFILLGQNSYSQDVERKTVSSNRISDQSVNSAVSLFSEETELGCGTTVRDKIMPENYYSFPDIDAGGWWIEQPYNTKVIRCTDTGEKNTTYSYHRYSSVCVFNHTGDYFITFHREPEVWLHDGRNGVPLRKLKISRTTCVWSMVDENLIYYVNNNKFRSYNVQTDEDLLVREFDEESGMDFGGNEGDISNDGRFVCFSSQSRTRWFVYDIFDDIKYTVLEVADGNIIDAAQISPSGNYVVIEYALFAADDYQEGVGCCVHDTKTMEFIRNIYYPKTQHNDVGFDDEGDEAMFITDVQGDFAGGGPSSVVSIKLETAEKKLIHYYDEITWTIAHYSQRCCANQNEYVICSLYVLSDIDPNSTGWKPYWNELFAIPTDTSKETIRLVPTRSNLHGQKKWALEPRASINRQGDRVIFTSNLNDTNNEWCDVFMVTLEEPDTVPPLAPVNLMETDNSYDRVIISWETPGAAEDGDLPRNYKVYRDSTLLGYTRNTSYTDSTVDINSQYTYSVYSVDESAVTCNEPNSISVSTGEDTDPPYVSSIIPLGLQALAIHFNEAIEVTDALDINNFQISNNIEIQKLAVACGQAVLFSTSEQVAGENYTLSITGIRDTSPQHNEMETVQVPFTAVEGCGLGYNDFADNFDAADSSQWQLKRADLWSFLEDQGQQVFGTNTSNYQSPGPGLLGTYALVKNSVFVDFTLSCDVRCPDSNSGADFALIWNYKDNYNYNYVMFNRIPSLNELFVVEDSLRTTLTNFGDFNEFEQFASDYHNITVEVKSCHFTVRFDGTIVVEGDDDTFKYGKVGIGSFNDWAYFDNFSITVDKEFMTSVDKNAINAQPKSFKLEQNYPNPFNPSTNINYSLPKTEKVTITIYNLMGQRVAVLVDKKQASGDYQIVWDAHIYPSGLYFYEFRAGEFTARKKMLLLK